MGRYEEHLKAERAKAARIWNGIIYTPEVPEHRDPGTHMTARDEYRSWVEESARHMRRPDNY